MYNNPPNKIRLKIISEIFQKSVVSWSGRSPGYEIMLRARGQLTFRVAMCSGIFLNCSLREIHIVHDTIKYLHYNILMDLEYNDRMILYHNTYHTPL